jgi:hypothetical protein
MIYYRTFENGVEGIGSDFVTDSHQYRELGSKRGWEALLAGRFCDLLNTHYEFEDHGTKCDFDVLSATDSRLVICSVLLCAETPPPFLPFPAVS